MKHVSPPLAGLAVRLAACLALAGCTRPAVEPQGMTVPTVTVSQPLQREVQDYEEYTGRTAAVESVQARARVTGYLDKILFKEGAEVNQGDVLYEIDPRPYQAVLDQAEAQVRLQEANLKFQEAEYARNAKLVRTGAVSTEDLQRTLAARDTAAASLNAARAAVEQARLNLEFTKVRSPITGLMGRTFITRGNLVVADQTLLTTIVSEDPMYAYFDVDEPTVLRIREQIRQGRFRSAREEGVRVPVWLGLETEQDYPHEGYIDFINNQVDPATGTLQVRGVFANPKPKVGPRLLSPGLFVRLRVVIGPPYQALLVTPRAIGTDQNLKYVYVVDDQNKVVRRDVQLGPEREGLQVIREGLKPDDQVIVNGLPLVRPGMVVNPKPAGAPTSPAPAGTTTASPGAGAPTPNPSQSTPTMQQGKAGTQTRQ